MKQGLLHYLMQFGLAIVILSACFVLFSSSSLAATSRHSVELESPVGTWNLIVTFVTGPRAPGTSTQVITFNADGTLTAITPGLPDPGTGKWSWMDQQTGTFQYSIIEPIPTGESVHVQQVAVLLGEDIYQATGCGILYTSQGVPVQNELSMTRTYATRA